MPDVGRGFLEDVDHFVDALLRAPAFRDVLLNGDGDTFVLDVAGGSGLLASALAKREVRKRRAAFDGRLRYAISSRMTVARQRRTRRPRSVRRPQVRGVVVVDPRGLAPLDDEDEAGGFDVCAARLRAPREESPDADAWLLATRATTVSRPREAHAPWRCHFTIIAAPSRRRWCCNRGRVAAPSRRRWRRNRGRVAAPSRGAAWIFRGALGRRFVDRRRSNRPRPRRSNRPRPRRSALPTVVAARSEARGRAGRGPGARGSHRTRALRSWF